MQRIVLIVVAVCSSAAAATSVAAQDLCVICSAPEATYRCQPDTGPSRSGDMRLQLACVAELAKAGGHGSCAVQRSNAAPCNGPLRTVTLTGDPLQPVTAAPTAEPATVSAPPQTAGEKKQPGTVVELAKETAATSKKQLENAGEAVGDAAKKAGGAVEAVAKKSWNCLTSLFKGC